MSVKQIIEETRAEVSKVNWPAKQRVIQLTIVVLALSLAMTIITALMDITFGNIFDLINARF